MQYMDSIFCVLHVMKMLLEGTHSQKSASALFTEHRSKFPHYACIAEWGG